MARLTGFAYRGGKRKIAYKIISLLPPSGGRIVEPFAGRASLSLAAMQLLDYPDYWLNDNKWETLNFLVMLKTISPHLYAHKVLPRTRNNQKKLKADTYEKVFSRWLDEAPQGKKSDVQFVLDRLKYRDGGDATAPFEALAEPYHAFNRGTADGGGLSLASKGGVTLRGYLRELANAHALMNKHNIKFTMKHYQQVLDEALPSDIVLIDPPYRKSKPGPYVPLPDEDYPALVQRLIRAPYRWLLMEYEGDDNMYRALGEPVRIPAHKSNRKGGWGSAVTECVWSNFDVLDFAVTNLERIGKLQMGKETEQLIKTLERQIDEAQAAIRAIRRAEAADTLASTASSKATKKKGSGRPDLSAATRKKLSDAAKKRWANRSKA